MTNKALSGYADRIPSEVKSMVVGLADDDRLGLVIALLEHGKMSFSEMKARFGMSSSSLVNMLNLLQNGNLVHNFYGRHNGRVSSYYDATELSESMLKSILDVAFGENLLQGRQPGGGAPLRGAGDAAEPPEAAAGRTGGGPGPRGNGRHAGGRPLGRTEPPGDPEIYGLVADLKSAGFFDEPRSLEDIARELARRGHERRPRGLSAPLAAAARRGIVRKVGAGRKCMYAG